ncbi:MAG: hypothetical protein R3F34_05785 [Planctomycetota bacterium]
MTRSDLLNILDIAYAVSFDGPRISMSKALSRANYAKLRPHIGPEDLVPLIRERPDYVRDWIGLSGDKRAAGGWEVGEDGTVGSMFDSRTFASVEEAVANFVVLELDYHVALDRSCMAWLVLVVASLVGALALAMLVSRTPELWWIAVTVAPLPFLAGWLLVRRGRKEDASRRFDPASTTNDST